MTEQQPYDVVRIWPAFELRRYSTHAVAEVTVSAGFADAGNRAFRSLFGYLSGDNTAKRKVAMTAPVVQAAAPGGIAMTAPVVQSASGEGSFVIAFVLPAAMTAMTAPEPTRPEVSIREVPSALSAVVRYSGRWTRESYERHCAELLASVAEAGLTPVGDPRFARFDPPYTPWFLRRNEVAVDVVEGGR